jgi:hypothetical protein
MPMIDYFHFPKEALLQKRLPKIQLQAQSKLHKNSQKKIYGSIEDIYLLANLTQDTLRLREVETDDEVYRSIQYLAIECRNFVQIESIIQEFHLIFPNPIILELRWHDQIKLSCATKRRSKSDSSKSVVQEYWNSDLFELDDKQTSFLEDLNSQNQTYKDLRSFYLRLIEVVYSQNTIPLLGEYRRFPSNQLGNHLLQIHSLKSEINKLQQKQSELSMRDRMDLHQQQLNKQQQLLQAIEELKELTHGKTI